MSRFFDRSRNRRLILEVRRWRELFRKSGRPPEEKKLHFDHLEPRAVPATLTVSILDDDSVLGDDFLSLREAINVANTDSTAGLSASELAQISGALGDDDIEFDSALFSGAQTLALTNNQLTISSNLTIAGPGQSVLTIDAGGNSRIFNVDDGDDGNASEVTISDLTLTGGSVSGNGGAVYNRENLTISESTISGNSAGSRGGGVYNNVSSVSVTNSTISGNSADFGGGVYNSLGSVSITNSTISGNSADFGGGIDNAAAGTLTLTNTIVANSTAGGDVAGSGTFTAAGANIVKDASLTGTGVLNVDPMLGPLADNGGPTFTHALLAGSPAVDAGDNTEANNAGLTTDQRGLARFVNAMVDIGAFEVQNTRLVTGAGSGAGPRVIVRDENGQVVHNFLAYNQAFGGGVRVATADFNGDGTPDIVTAAGPGGFPHVRVFDGVDLSPMASFFAYERSSSAASSSRPATSTTTARPTSLPDRAPAGRTSKSSTASPSTRSPASLSSTRDSGAASGSPPPTSTATEAPTSLRPPEPAAVRASRSLAAATPTICWPTFWPLAPAFPAASSWRPATSTTTAPPT